MTDQTFYVYALKDPRSSPAMPFYIGKGAGTRALDHLVRPDHSRKWARIVEIRSEGLEPLVALMVDAVTEVQALKLEAELIAAFGTMDTGGILTNSVMPSGLGAKSRGHVIVPSGTVEKAQLGLSLLKDAVLEFAKGNVSGITNSDASSLLGLRSDYGGGSKDYLAYSVLGLLMKEGKIKRQRPSKRHIAQVQ